MLRAFVLAAFVLGAFAGAELPSLLAIVGDLNANNGPYAGQFSQLISILSRDDSQLRAVRNVLNGITDDSYTLFLPTDAAFSGVSTSSTASNNAALARIIQYHLYQGTYSYAALQRLEFGMLQAATGEYASVMARGNRVLFPPRRFGRRQPDPNGEPGNRGPFGDLFDSGAGGLNGRIRGPGFDRAPQISGVVVTDGDIQTRLSGDVSAQIAVHVVGQVLQPATASIQAMLGSYPYFDILLGAFDEVRLTSLLTGTNQYTLLAPTNAAFNALELSTIAFIDSDPGILREILEFHVISGVYSVSDLANAGTDYIITRFERGGPLPVVGRDWYTRIVIEDTNTNARITRGNILCGNGVIHHINQVLLPTSVFDAAGSPRKIQSHITPQNTEHTRSAGHFQQKVKQAKQAAKKEESKAKVQQLPQNLPTESPMHRRARANGGQLPKKQH